MMAASTWTTLMVSCLVIASSFPQTAAQQDSDVWRHPGSNPRLPYTHQDDQTYNEGASVHLSGGDIHLLKKIIDRLPIKTPILNLVHDIATEKQADDPSKAVYLSFEEDLLKAEEDLVRKLVEDAGFRAQFFQSPRRPPPANYDAYVAAIQEEDSNIELEDVPDLEDRNQTKGYEGCKRDFDMVYLPVTEEFMYRLARRINSLFPNRDPIDVIHPSQRRRVAAPLVDAVAKRPTGLYQGVLHWVGAFEQCERAGVNYSWIDPEGSGEEERRIFRGLYTRLIMPLVAILNESLPMERIDAFRFQMGICAPDTCSDADIIRYITDDNDMLTSVIIGGPIFHRNVTYVFTGVNVDFFTDIGAIVALCITLGVAIVVIIASCWDGFLRQKYIQEKLQEQIGGSKKKKVPTATLR